MNDYRDFVDATAQLHEAAAKLGPSESFNPLPPPAEGAPVALIFSPHPDDECIIGALPLRLRREEGWRVVNVAVTLGSLHSRRAERLEELKKACTRLNFDLLVPDGGGLERVRIETRRADPHHWTHSVNVIGKILLETAPDAIFIPHGLDGNPTHVGVNALVRHALYRTGKRLRCLIVETEFWAPQEAPNLLAEVSPGDLAQLLEALACHTGEIERNPYQLRLPAWMIDNVRRAGERLGGAGSRPPDFLFGTPYNIRLWDDGKATDCLGGAFLSSRDSAGTFVRELLDSRAPGADPII